MKKDSPLIVAQECDDDIDSLLDASLHEQNFVSSHGSAKFLSVNDLGNSTAKGVLSHEATPLCNRNDVVTHDYSNGFGSIIYGMPKSQNSCFSVTGTEVKIVRRDSVISAVTLGESLSNKRPDLQEIAPVPHSPSPPSATVQDSDSSFSGSTADRKQTLKRRSSFVSDTKYRNRSISFSETVDKVTYDENSCVSQASERLDRVDIQERGTPVEKRLSYSSSLAVIEDESPTAGKKKIKGFGTLMRWKKKK